MKSVKTNGRVEVPVKVLELARQDFLAERVSSQGFEFERDVHPSEESVYLS